MIQFTSDLVNVTTTVVAKGIRLTKFTLAFPRGEFPGEAAKLRQAAGECFELEMKANGRDLKIKARILGVKAGKKEAVITFVLPPGIILGEQADRLFNSQIQVTATVQEPTTVENQQVQAFK